MKVQTERVASVWLRKKLAEKDVSFDLFEGPPEAEGVKDAPADGFDDMFALPSALKAPGEAKKAPAAPKAPSAPPAAKAPAADPFDDMFALPSALKAPAAPQKPPAAPPKPPAAQKPPAAPQKPPAAPRAPSAPPKDDLFALPPEAPRKPATPPAPSAKPPVAEPAPGRPPTAPPAAPSAPPRTAPPGEGREVPQGPETEAMRRTRDFKEFVREIYQAGKADIPHPDPKRRLKKPTVKFWTAMKYDTFKAKVKKEFAAWRAKAEAGRPRAEVGAKVSAISELRVGDFVKGNYRARYKVIKRTPKAAILVHVDEHGRPKDDKKYTWNDRRLRGWNGRLTRTEELKRPTDDESIKKFLDDNFGYPPKAVDTQEKYRAWAEDRFNTHGESPFRRLGDEEKEHLKHRDEVIAKLLKDRGIGDDWKGGPPPAAEIGHRVFVPQQVQVGQFLDQNGGKYKVLEISDDVIKVDRVDAKGIPRGRIEEFDRWHLEHYQNRRIDEIKRPIPSWEEAKKFADDEIGYPEREVGDQQQYREWLDQAFREKSDSPFRQLGKDDKELKELLAKQIEKVLSARGIGKGWKWEPPPHAEIGQRVRDPYQVHRGDFIQDERGNGYRILDVSDQGALKVLQVNVNTGRPTGRPTEFDKKHFASGYRKYTRIDEIKRPDVSLSAVQEYINVVGFPLKKDANSYDEYRAWVKNKLIEKSTSPFYQLAEDETEHQKKLEKYLDAILKERKIDPNWEWTPPPELDIGAKVADPMQLRVGHIIQRKDRDYGFRIVAINDDDSVEVVGVDKNGRPNGDNRQFGKYTFENNPYTRVEPLQRQIPPEKDLREFANANFEHPPRDVGDQDAYRDWMREQFLTNRESPYVGLAEEEGEHKKSLEKLITSLMSARGIGKDWKWKSPPIVSLPANKGWEQDHDVLRDIVLKGKSVRPAREDPPLGGGGVNGGVRRRMKLGDKEQDYAFKSSKKEKGHYRSGTPSGTLHLREQAAYGLDRILGDGVVVPPTVSDGTGSYQSFVDGAQNWGGGDRGKVTPKQLLRHPEVQRTILLDFLMGHEDRHSSNMMFSWADPKGPKTIDNIRFHAIDNGYAFASPEDKHGPNDFVVRHPWDNEVVEGIAKRIPDELHDQLKKVDIGEALKAVAGSGIKNRGALRTTGVRIRALQANPEVIGKIMKEKGLDAREAQQEFHWLASSDPAKLFQEYSGLPTSALDDINRQVDAALA